MPKSDGILLVLTDVFMSATAALLIALALNISSDSHPLGVQADIIVVCEYSADESYSYRAYPAIAPDIVSGAISKAGQFSKFVHDLPIEKGLLQRIVLVGARGVAPLSGCLQKFKKEIVWPSNAAAEKVIVQNGGSQTIFTVTGWGYSFEHENQKQ